MNGLELSEAYYNKIGRPAIEQQLPEVFDCLAAGLVGDGSECFGYDDEYSRDHDYGPGFCLWLTEEGVSRYGAQLQQLYDSLPGSFAGFPARRNDPRSGKRVGVFSVSAFYQRYIGKEQPPSEVRRWYLFSDDQLAAAVNGKVFEDNAGEFSSIREVLLGYYPERIRLQKIASCLHLVSQSGQYNYGRCLKRGEIMAAEICCQEFFRNVIHLVHLLDKKYEPYYKWAWRSFTLLPDAAELIPLMQCMMESPVSTAAGAEQRAALIERICSVLLALLKQQELAEGNELFLDRHVRGIAEKADLLLHL